MQVLLNYQIERIKSFIPDARIRTKEGKLFINTLSLNRSQIREFEGTIDHNDNYEIKRSGTGLVIIVE